MIINPEIPFFSWEEKEKMKAWVLLRESRSRCLLSPLIRSMYRIKYLRPVARKLMDQLEGGTIFSQTLRDILREERNIIVGKYTYSSDPWDLCVLPRGTRIGNYSSLARGIIVMRRNHPTERLSLHPFFFARMAGLLEKDTIIDEAENPLLVGSDVWIGENTLILPGCRKIGDGAVIGGGSIVTRDVEPFAVVAGNPARLIRKRFPPEIVECLMARQWWQSPLSELVDHVESFLQPYQGIAWGNHLGNDAMAGGNVATTGGPQLSGGEQDWDASHARLECASFQDLQGSGS